MSNFIIRPGVDIPAMLKNKGFSSYRIAREKIFCSGAMQKFRDGKLPSWGELAKLVHLLKVSPCDLIAYQTDSGVILDLTGQVLQRPEPAITIQHGHPGDAAYDPDDPGDDPDDDDLPPAIPPEYIR